MIWQSGIMPKQRIEITSLLNSFEAHCPSYLKAIVYKKNSKVRSVGSW
jgi:hypothetical protein